jgi:hypothetical protein
MDNALNSLVNVLDHQGNKEHDDVAGYNVEISVVDRDLDGVSVTGW